MGVAPSRQDLLRQLPSISDLLKTPRVAAWLNDQPQALVADCLRHSVDELRQQVLSDAAGRCGGQHVTADAVLDRAQVELQRRTSPRLRGAINATGIILHTGLGRAVLPACAVDGMAEQLKGYVTLAVDRDSGQRINRDSLVEPLLCELTGAEAATVINNNAAATMLVLAALAAGREVVVSRGELIEIGGEFRLPEVMAQSGARMVEVGATNRTHRRDYERAITDQTALLFRAHPSNYRIVGFASAVPVSELVEIAHAPQRGASVAVVDDLGAGALVGLEHFGLPHEPTMAQSIAAGADVVLASTDKLIGAGQGGVILGKRPFIEKIRKHPLARAVRADKMCLMALERTLPLFRDMDVLVREHPTYRMLATSMAMLVRRADALAAAVNQAVGVAAAGRAVGSVSVEVADDVGYLGSGSLPMEALPTRVLRLRSHTMKAEALARALRLDEACVFTRVADDAVVLDVRTLTDDEIPLIAAAVGRVLASA
jgi:L-seryl-tRNA(Ser) seleniumtransferase